MTERHSAVSAAVGHVGLNVTDLDRSVAFYSQVLGLDVLRVGEEPQRRYAFLGATDTPVLTLWQQSGGAFEAHLPGLHHLAFEAPDVAAVRRVEATLRALGAPIAHDGAVRHAEGSGSVGVFAEDPDGIRLEVYAPTGATTEPAPSGAASACGFF